VIMNCDITVVILIKY